MKKSDLNTSSTQWHPEQPYNQLPNLPPQKVNLESRAILKQCIEARAALATLQQVCRLIPNPTILINALPLLEAKDSSSIENIITTTDKLFQYAYNEKQADSATKETLSYRHALYEGFRSLQHRPLCTATAVAVCRILKHTELDIRCTIGTYLTNNSAQQIIYTPPEGEHVLRNKLANWEKFLHDHHNIDPLIRMAVGHYQFEAIHPFSDENGRTGRILNILFLIQEALLDLPILHLSRYINTNKSHYYDLLLKVTKHQSWELWILFMLSAVKDAAYWTTDKINAIYALAEHTKQYVRQKLPKLCNDELIELLFERPYCRINDVAKKSTVTRQTASIYLKKFGQLGVLIDLRIAKERLWVHAKLMELLKNDQNTWMPYVF